VKDGLRTAIFLKPEVVLGQILDESASLVANGCEQFDQVNVG
jgi:hypothetical protein